MHAVSARARQARKNEAHMYGIHSRSICPLQSRNYGASQSTRIIASITDNTWFDSGR